MAKGELGHAIPEHVYVTGHAVTRLRERFPAFRQTDEHVLQKLIRTEISDAFRAGRVARRQPRWTIYHADRQHSRRGTTRGKRVKGPPGTLYVWDAAEQRCYGVIKDHHDITGGMRVSVRTTMTRSTEGGA